MTPPLHDSTSDTSSHAPRPRFAVCFVALNAWPVIDSAAGGPIGGIETRAWMFARALARRGDFAVDFVVRHTRPPGRNAVDGVRLRPVVDRLYRIREAVGARVEKRPRFPWLKVQRWNHALLWQIPLLAACRPFKRRPADPWQPDLFLVSIGADVFCTFGVQSHSATVIASARNAARPVVLMLGSDGDLDERYVEGSDFVSPYGDRGDVCWRILQSADVIVAQTGEQQRLLERRFARSAIVISNPIDVAEWDARSSTPLSARETAGLARYVLWVGRAEHVHKRPQVLLELARLCPDVDFLMVLNPRDGEFEDRIRREAPANVRIVRSVPFPLMPAVFSRAAAFVSTSSLEGFPNVFLQAAVSRVPIATLEVGTEFLQRIGCGFSARGDLSALADFIRRVWTRGPVDAAALQRARELVVQQHALDAQCGMLADALRQALQREPTASAR